MKKFWFCGYREWSTTLYYRVLEEEYASFIGSRAALKNKANEIKDGDVVFFVGWSWNVPARLINRCMCICLHPSKLPKYRGGSPIQNQILDNLDSSSVTLFLMDDGIDTGKIIDQNEFSLNGRLDEIFDRIVNVGSRSIISIIRKIKNNTLKLIEQDELQASYCNRRTPQQSEITIDQINNLTAKQLYNKIRCLQDPYPLPYIVCKDGKKLFLLEAKYEE